MTDDFLTEDAMREDRTTDQTTTASRPAAWIGFLELEAWAETVDSARPVLLLPVAQPAGGDGPFQSLELLVSCQQVTAEGDVLYCLLRASTLTYVCGEIVDADWPFREMALESLWECAEAILEERGLTVLPASASCPVNSTLVLGQARGIRYDRVHRCFRRLTPVSAEAI